MKSKSEDLLINQNIHEKSFVANVCTFRRELQLNLGIIYKYYMLEHTGQIFKL